MRILIVSDSHGDETGLRWIAQQCWQRWPHLDACLHCGDGARDFERLSAFFLAHDPGIALWGVRGNCDFAAQVPEERVLSLGGSRLYLTHGHLLRVKQGLTLLDEEAERQECGIALYGHTHIQAMDTRRTLMINPGAACDGRYAVMELEAGRPRLHLETCA